MKIEPTKAQKFNPITITLETPEEVARLWALFNHTDAWPERVSSTRLAAANLDAGNEGDRTTPAGGQSAFKALISRLQ